MNVDQALQSAVAHHQQGRLDAAKSLYEQVLQVLPDQPDALHLLGVLLGQQNRPHDGIPLIRRAIKTKPNEAVFYNNLANQLRETGELDEAIIALLKALEIQPAYPDAHNNLGNVLLDQDHIVAAIDAYRQAIRISPLDARLHTNLGAALLQSGQLSEALASHRRAIELGPDLALGFQNYGAALHAAGHPQAALAVFQRAIELEALNATHRLHLAAELRVLGRLDEALTECQHALRLDPNSAEAYNAQANILGDLGRSEEAIVASRRAIQLKPALAEARANLGVGLGEQHQVPQALAALEEAIQIKPDLADAHRNYAMMLLNAGQFEKGWREYEWRWKAPSFRAHACNVTGCTAPRWAGEALEGKTILLTAEQGFGDAIQFARYIPLVVGRGGSVLVAAPKSLVRLLASVRGVQRVLTEITEADNQSIDLQCPLMSLPLTLGKPEPLVIAGYFSIEESMQRPWRERVDSVPAKTKVGVVWAGNPKLRTDRLRSVPIALWKPIFDHQSDQLQFFSLQLGPAAEQRPTVVHDFTNFIEDFADTAALISQLDLIIAVDTAVAHLAGALGKTTWTLLPFANDWRWQLDRTDSPWYPTMRLFRQPVASDWATPISQIANELRARLS